MSAWRTTGAPLLMVGVGRMGRGYLLAARARGLPVSVVESAEVLAELDEALPGLVGDREVVDLAALDAQEAWSEPALRLAGRCRPQAVLGFSEPHVLAAALVQDTYGLPGPGLRAALVSRNKALQRASMSVAGVEQPSFLLADGMEVDLPEQGPFVVKPLSSMGSNGVRLVSSPADVEVELDHRSGEGPQLIEEYVAGPEFSWEAVVQHGSTIFTNVTRKTTTGAPNFVEMRHVAGRGAVSEAGAAALNCLGRDVVAVLGVQDSIVHLEARRRTDGRLALIEVAVRAPGDFLMDVVGAAHGIDLYDVCLQVARGQRPQLPPEDRSRAAASLFVGADRPGVLREVDLGGLAAVPGVVRAEPRLAPGARVRPPEASWDRVAYALLTADGAGKLDRACEQALDAIRVVVDPE